MDEADTVLRPSNTIYRDGLPVAFIDRDVAAPAPSLWDIAHAEAGDPAFVAIWGTEHSDGPLRDAEFLRRHGREFTHELT